MSKGLNVVVAALGGFVAGILLAPKSGKETRQDIAEKARDTHEMAMDKADHIKTAARDGYESFRSGAQTVTDEVKGMSRSAKQSADNLAAEAKARGRRGSQSLKADQE